MWHYTFKFRILWTLISPTDQYLLRISTLSCSENLEKYFSLQAAPKGVRIFHSGISVSLYACPIFLCSLVLFLFHSDGADPFLCLPFGYLLSFFIVKSIFWSSFNAETLASSNEELFIFGIFWLRILSELKIRVAIWVTSFWCSFAVWWSSSTTVLRLFILSRSKDRRWSNWNNTLNYLRSRISLL